MADNDKLLYKDSDIRNLAAVANADTKDSITFKLADFGFIDSDAENLRFIKNAVDTGLAGWGTTKVDLCYYSNNESVFTTKESCPMPKVELSSDYYLAFSYAQPLSSTFNLKYDSTEKCCCIQASDSETWTKLCFDSVFVILQGGGGGGGEGSCLNIGATAQCVGGGGGGGGAFVLAYLNLKEIPDETVTITAGAAGIGGGAQHDHAQVLLGASGKPGADSTITYNGATILAAGGGRGGGGSFHGLTKPSIVIRGSGGAGGTVLDNTSDYSWITVLASIPGKAGGDSGNVSGYTVGIPYGTKHGDNGESYTAEDKISIPILKAEHTVYHESDSYIYGSGQEDSCIGTDGYKSGGGGGGASVMSAVAIAGKTSTSGYGIGGAGASAEAATVHTSYNGAVGFAAILDCNRL